MLGGLLRGTPYTFIYAEAFLGKEGKSLGNV